MWRTGTGPEEQSVVCIACGTSVPRSAAREYDKEGDRWDRRGKEFEHLCKECYRGLCHQPRGNLEEVLVELEREGEESEDRVSFLARYVERVEGSKAEERER